MIINRLYFINFHVSLFLDSQTRVRDRSGHEVKRMARPEHGEGHAHSQKIYIFAIYWV